MADDVGHYFDRQATEYFDERPGMKPINRAVARRIESDLDGSVLSVGGLWFDARTDSARFRVTVVDVSPEMLAAQGSSRELRVRADARRLPFRDGSFDHVVMPLVLHHIAGRNGLEARRGAAQALGEARRVTAPAGRIWINEFCVSPAIYAIELLASPLTRAALGVLKTPLVIMHSYRFYTGLLQSLGYRDVRRERITASAVRRTDLITPILGVPQIRIPRFLYPVEPTLITARVP